MTLRAPSLPALATALLAVMAGRASATVYDLSKLASSHDDVLYQWTFNIGAHGGMTDAASGDVNLVHAKHPSTVKEAGVLPGFDASTLALRTYQDSPGNRTVGAALRADGALNLMQSATVEYLFNVETVANNSYIVAGFNDAGSRRYFGQVGTSTVVRAYVHETARDILPGDDNQIPFSTDNWYYVALTFDPVVGQPNHTRMNAYVADLTAGDTNAIRTQNVWVPIPPAATTLPTLGFGCLGDVVDGDRYFLDGFVDQVSIYGRRLTVDEINAHVAAIQQQPDLRVDLDVFRNYPSMDPNWVPDVSSWRNDAILGLSPTTTAKNPTRGTYGFYFDPSAADGGQVLTLERNDSLRVADIGGGQDMSVEMWLRADTIPATGSASALVDNRASTSAGGGWMLTLRDDGAVRASYYGTGSTLVLESDPGLLVSDGRYQHLVMSLDDYGSGSGEATFYVNGQQWGNPIGYTGASGYVEPDDVSFRIGHHRTDGSTGIQPFHGEISGFVLYAKALDHGEVLERFQLGVPEPTTAVMFLFGAVFLLVTRRRRVRSVQSFLLPKEFDMNTQVIKSVTRLLLAAALLAAVSSRANATVYDLSRLASDHDNILYQWTFNVGMDGGLKDARSGDVNLVDARRNTEELYAEALPGFDASTDALRAYQVNPGNRSAGAALRTEGPLSLPSSGTVEYLFNVLTPATNGASYIAGSNNASGVSGNRRYYGSVASGGGSVSAAFGDPSVSGSLLSSTTVPLVNNEWYYVALAFEPNLVNGYVANLTAGHTTATHTLVNLNANAGGTLPRLGLGCYAHATDTNHFLHGFVDQVSIYGSPLSHDEINDHVAAIQQKPDLRVDLDVFRNYPSVDPNWMPDASSWRNDAILGRSPTTTTNNPSRGQYGFTFDPNEGGHMLTLERNASLRVADIGNNQGMSVEMWLDADTIGGTLIDTRHTNYDGWAMTIRDGGRVWAKFYERSSGTHRDWTVESDPGLVKADGRYQHLVMSLDADEFGGGTATFYVNGQEWGTAAYSNASTYVDPATAPIRIGHQALGITTSMTPFHGEISGFALHSKALDHGEVLARFALGVPEPTTAMMVLFGAIFLLATRRRARGVV